MLSIFLIIVLGGAGGYYMYDREEVTFTSFAEVRVERNFQRMLETDREVELRNTTEYDIFRNEQVGLIMRPDVLEDGLRRAGQLENGTWAPEVLGPSAAVAGFSRALDVYLLRNTYRIAVDITGYNPYVLQDALDGLLAAFLDAHRLEFSFEKDERPEVLRGLIEELDAKIADKRGGLKAAAEKLNVLDFSETRSNPWVTPLENARLALVEAERSAITMKLELELEDPLEATDAMLEMVLLGGAESINEGLAQVVGPLVARRAEIMNRMLAMNPGHVARAGLEVEVKSLEGQIKDLLARHSEASRTGEEMELRRVEKRIEQLNTEVEKLGKNAKDFVSSFQEGMVLETTLTADLERHAQITERLNYFELENQSPSFVSVAQAPTNPEQGESKLIRNLALVAILTLILAIGLPLLIDLKDNRVHTTQDVEAVFGFPPAIWIPEPKRGAQMHLAKDQIRRFALALDRDQSYATSRLVQFTEVKSGKGSQNVVNDIASALAAFGRKVLVVDAAAPRTAKAMGAQTTGGFLGLMAGRGLEVVARDGWDFLEYGNPLNDPAHVFAGWDKILRDGAAAYDLVLIRADPLLGSADAEHMASSVDVVVLMVEAQKQTRGEVQRAGDVLASLHPAAVGTLLHNAKIFHGRGYYRELLKSRKALPPS